VEQAELSEWFSSTTPDFVSCFWFVLRVFKTGLSKSGRLIVGNLKMTLLENNFYINSF
jgi:hypothetical protein